ncbi:MAG: hypothetical protein KMY53_08035 [Desulfarculus sp.]|nr:hypothetical protein [Pseudomonadota bacterium]MBV1716805.1 hypothetical protein [Desulfarculus sp.]MBU4573182.1 hypothetical protein [Pseudomonadota bacterium]MBU4598862.1 hypothetical protein [Pseudomonadota bacterium]MBV1738095.1 hypothetical protein [Desulfarculus sp.]
MVALVGGLIALLLGIIGIFAWWDEFLWLLKGVIPPILILGGVLATYLGAEEMKDKKRAESESAMEPFSPASAGDEEAERYKKEVAELKAKLAAMEESDKAVEVPEGAKTGEEEKAK